MSERDLGEKEALEQLSARLDRKMRFAVKRAREVDFIPYTTENGQWKKNDIGWWTNGFWPASMWQMYLMTGDEMYREEAIRAEKMLDAALRNFKNLDHDVGFLWLIHSGVRHCLEKNPDSFDRTLFAATTLAARFNPAGSGFIRAWTGGERAGWAIIDCMMNLPLLYWASHETGDPRYKNIAMRHADTAMRYFVRADGSCNHIVCFDPETGAYLDNPAGQGYESGSCWSRGQAWALYGFTLSYLHTGRQEYLDTARRTADFFIAHLTDEGVPRCDFRQPALPDIRDSAAGAIACCGLMELARQVSEKEAPAYDEAALKLFRALEKEEDWTEDTPAILQKCTTAYHDESGRHITMDYADYFFIEAIHRLRGQKLLFWKPF